MTEVGPNGNLGYLPVLLSNQEMDRLFRQSVAHNPNPNPRNLGQHRFNRECQNQVNVVSYLPLPPHQSNRRRGSRRRKPRSASTHAPHTEPPASSVAVPSALGERQLSITSLQNFERSFRARASWKNAYSKVKMLLQRETFFLFQAPIGMTPMHETRWLEVLDPKHRYGGELEKQSKIWNSTNSCKNFFEWLKDQPVSISEVQYLSSTARRFYKLRVENGVCRTDKEGILHTEDVDAPHIFVLSTMRICYVGRYDRGFFHHSSLVAGEPVLAAGEMIFSKKGKLKQITDKSGHYRTEAAATRAIVCYLQTQSIDMEHIVVSTDCVREPFITMRHAPGKEFLKVPARDFRSGSQLDNTFEKS